MIVFRNLLAVIVGFVVGSLVNMTLVVTGHRVIAPPPGMNPANSQSFIEHAPLMEPRHFLFPFLAHALGVLAGGFLAYLVAGSRRAVFAYAIAVLFLAGGIAACFMIPAPAWFIALDLLGAYLPMAWLAVRLGRKVVPAQNPGAGI